MVNYLIANGGDIEIENQFGENCFLTACRNGHFEIAESLLKHGAKVNIKDANKMTALHHAVLANSLEIVELLVKNRMDVNAKNFEEMTPIKYIFTHAANSF